jgi:Uma2 family endonuclease
MTILHNKAVPPDLDYPDSQGRPMGETPRHRKAMTDAIETLEVWFASDPHVFVSGSMLVHYVPGNRLRNLSPDVVVARGVPKERIPERRSFRVWEEGKGPDFVLELTSLSTREEDMDDKFWVYRDVLKVHEYFLFDPYRDYLNPPLQGHRLEDGRYVPIDMVDGRLPSEVLGLHLESCGAGLRFFDPAIKRRIITPREVWETYARLEVARHHEAVARLRAEAEVERLRAELEALRRRLPEQP